jgi:hypothetical protein
LSFYRSEKLIETKLKDLESDLVRITSLKSSSSKPSSGSSLVGKPEEDTSKRQGAYLSPNRISSAGSKTDLKYSTSNNQLADKQKRRDISDESLPLYSKSATSIREIQQSSNIASSHQLTTSNCVFNWKNDINIRTKKYLKIRTTINRYFMIYDRPKLISFIRF